MAKERYLVTGANGFIGANVTRRLLAEGLDVVPAIGPSGENWRINDLSIVPIQLDVTDLAQTSELIKKYKPSHIINLATYGVYRDQKDADLIYKTNAIGISNLARAAIDNEIDMLINTGSVFEYGSLAGEISEENMGEIRNPYDEAKTDGTKLAHGYHQKFGLPVLTLRLFTTYGPYEDSRRLVAGTILKMLNGLEVVMSPDSIRDFVYVNDVADAYISALSHPEAAGEVINIGSGEPHLVGDVVSALQDLIPSKTIVTKNNTFNPTNDSRCWANIDKARQIINWQPQTSLEQGLRETVEWYKTNSIKYK